MGAFADSLFAVLMSWVRALVSGLWALIGSERTSVLEFLGKNWLTIVAVLVAAGLVIDWLIWMIRWKPYALRGRMREAKRREEEAERKREMALAEQAQTTEPEEEESYIDDEDAEEDWLPERPAMDEEDEQEAIERADSVPDEELGVYPGMRYDEQPRHEAAEQTDGTRRFAAIHQEGPGAEEVKRRRAEIDAWQQQMKEEERAARERRMEEMRRAEEARLAEEARIAEEARQAEEARRAQEEYRRQLEEYEKEKARYEQEMAQYQRDLAAYEAAMARRAQVARQAQKEKTEAARELAPEAEAAGPRTRARRRAAPPPSYSELVAGEAVEQLPASPAWPKMEESMAAVKKTEAVQKKAAKNSGFIGKMAQLIEPEQEEISGVNALPPRIDPHEAYRPAAQPEGQKRRRK